ncbi:MAG: MFS transporter [Acidobacteriaceae bacterium]|nr:MFS transporter [Acidobacteriaceae bacterium]
MAPEQRRIRAAWWGTIVLFLVHGLVFSTWVSRIPAVQAQLRLNNGILGLTLLSSAIGAVSTIPLAGWLVTRYGSKRISIAGGILFSLSIVPMALAINAATLALALLFYGSTAATMDVAMNAHGVEVEKALGTSTMSRFHALFSAGGMGGAAIGGMVAESGIGPLRHFAISAGINMIAVLLVSRLLLQFQAPATVRTGGLSFRKMPAVLIALSAIAFCSLLAEGAMADWTTVYFRQVLQAGPGIAAFAYALFSAIMALFRFIGDWVIARLGPRLALQSACLLAAAGLLWGLLMRTPSWALPGFAVTGAGFSIIIPIVYGSGGRIEGVSPGAGIATVTGIGYIGFIVGPPAIGFASQMFTLRYALLIVVGCCVTGALLSRAIRPTPRLEVAATSEIHL